MKFAMQFIDHCFGLLESFLANGRNPINSSLTSTDILQNRLQHAVALEAMQERIERAGADAIPVTRQLLHHG